MKTISVEKYVEGVNSIYTEQPKYQLGHDGSDGTCDCIGMCRGGLKRGGAEGVSGMSGTNYAARHTIRNLQKIKKEAQLCVGDVVLKTRDAHDADYPLPEQYFKAGNDYSATVGETNYTHIGTVTRINPIEITHMTSPTAKKDTKLGKWSWFGQLPWVSAEAVPEEPGSTVWATVHAESGKTVKMRAKPSTLCRTYWEVPVGSQVMLTDPGGEWSAITWAGRSGWMMSKFLMTGELYTVAVNHLDRLTAEEIVGIYGGTMTEER